MSGYNKSFGCLAPCLQSEPLSYSIYAKSRIGPRSQTWISHLVSCCQLQQLGVSRLRHFYTLSGYHLPYPGIRFSLGPFAHALSIGHIGSDSSTSSNTVYPYPSLYYVRARDRIESSSQRYPRGALSLSLSIARRHGWVRAYLPRIVTSLFSTSYCLHIEVAIKDPNARKAQECIPWDLVPLTSAPNELRAPET